MLMRVHELTKTFHTSSGGDIHAVCGASLEIGPGETVGLLGSSGSGKTTLGQMLCGLLRPSGGRMEWRGSPLKFPFAAPCRRSIQILFQQPETSFNPRLKLIQSLSEPYKFYKLRWDRKQLCENIRQYGLYEEHLDRYPGELSGGELQRAALARILVLKPELIVLDEPTSMLDSISQAQIIRLLQETQEQNGTAFLFISHHHTLARFFCRRIYRIHNGRVEKEG